MTGKPGKNKIVTAGLPTIRSELENAVAKQAG
jgi:hypothetical protein